MTQNNVFSEAESKAKQARKELGLDDGPIRDIFSLLQDQQVFLVRMPMETGGIAGAFYYDTEKNKAHMLINSKNTLGRQRFTAAHEYGHLLFDKNDIGLIIENIKEKKSDKEQRADCFAANFLMPEEGIKLYIKNVLKKGAKLDNIDLAKIKNEYGVSWLALIYRLKDLGYSFEKNYREMIETQISALNTLALEMGFDMEISNMDSGISLPSEYSRLAFRAYFEEKISLEKLAEFLRISYEETKDKVAKIKLSKTNGSSEK